MAIPVAEAANGTPVTQTDNGTPVYVVEAGEAGAPVTFVVEGGIPVFRVNPPEEEEEE